MNPALPGSVVFAWGCLLEGLLLVVAAAVGAGFGGLWLWTGSLLLPIAAHATYDFLALVYLTRSRPTDRSPHQPDNLRT